MTPSHREPLHFHLLLALNLALAVWVALQALGVPRSGASSHALASMSAAALLMASDADSDAGPVETLARHAQ